MNVQKEIFNIGDIFTTKTGLISAISGGVGGFISWMYGGTSYNFYCMIALFFVIGFDWTGGIAASKKDGSYASAYGLQGVLRTFVMILLPAFGVVLDLIFKTPNIVFFLFWGGIMFHTLNSMTANFTRAGWDKWIPIWAINFVSSEIEAKVKRSESRTNTEGDGK